MKRTRRAGHVTACRKGLSGAGWRNRVAQRSGSVKGDPRIPPLPERPAQQTRGEALRGANPRSPCRPSTRTGRTKAAARRRPAAVRAPRPTVRPPRLWRPAADGITRSRGPPHTPLWALLRWGGGSTCRVPPHALLARGGRRDCGPPPPPHTPPEGERPRPAPPIRTPSGSRPHAFVQPSSSRIGRRGESPILIDTHTHN